jgi:hypothetical protein
VETTLKNLRIVQLAMLASVVLYGLLCFRLPVQGEPKPILLELLVIVSVSLVGMIFFFRGKTVLRAESVLAAQPEDPAALGRLRMGYIAIWAFCESIALYGVVLHFIGFTLAQVLPFLVAGFVLILFFSPRRPVETR